LGWLLRGLGDFGAQTGEATQLNEDFAAKQQEMKIQAARQKIAELMAPLQVQEVQARLRELQQPKNAGIIATPGGGTSGVTYRDGKFSQQPLVAGADPKAIKAQIAAMAAKAPPQYQGALEAIGLSIDSGEDPLKALDKANTLMGQAAGKEAANEGKPRFSFEPEKGIIRGADNKEWSIYDPDLPPDLKKLVDAEKKRKSDEAEQKATVEARKNAEAITKALTVMNMQEAKKGYDNVLKAATRGAAGHSFLKSVEDQVDAARANNGNGTTSGDLLLIEGYMQLMFGADPKALRGSPQMQTQLLKQGGVDDQAVAWWQSVKSGGRLSQGVREQILDASKSQVGAFDQYVNTTGQLVDDPTVKKLVTNYNARIAGTGSSQSPNKKNDATDLGGTPAPGVH
jgi:hypothetical protein